jgi:tRNA (pseudouridine54-N1)-methyltransferase
MRRFILSSHRAPLDAEISLDDLPGHGRFDLLARSVTAAFLLSHDIREDVKLSLVVRDSLVIRLDGAELRHLHPDERSTAALLRSALEAKDGAIGAIEANPSPGVYVGRGGLAELLEEIDGTLVQLQEDGEPTIRARPPADPIFVLSDHESFASEEMETLEKAGARRVKIGPKRIHADHAIAIAHNWVDTAGYEQY